MGWMYLEGLWGGGGAHHVKASAFRGRRGPSRKRMRSPLLQADPEELDGADPTTPAFLRVNRVAREGGTQPERGCREGLTA